VEDDKRRVVVEPVGDDTFEALKRPCRHAYGIAGVRLHVVIIPDRLGLHQHALTLGRQRFRSRSRGPAVFLASCAGGPGVTGVVAGRACSRRRRAPAIIDRTDAKEMAIEAPQLSL
jgi:hypothetical protein